VSADEERAHPLAVLVAAVVQALELELDRQDADPRGVERLAELEKARRPGPHPAVEPGEDADVDELPDDDDDDAPGPGLALGDALARREGHPGAPGGGRPGAGGERAWAAQVRGASR
jgi:hypothetical protein